jgi:hypothetical protein
MYKNEIYNEEELEELLRLNEKTKELKLDALVYLCNTGKDIYEKMEDDYNHDSQLIYDKKLQSYVWFNTREFVHYCLYGEYPYKSELFIKREIEIYRKNQKAYYDAYNNDDVKEVNVLAWDRVEECYSKREFNIDDILQQDFINYCNTGYYLLSENQKKRLLKLKE